MMAKIKNFCKRIAASYWENSANSCAWRITGNCYIGPDGLVSKA